MTITCLPQIYRDLNGFRQIAASMKQQQRMSNRKNVINISYCFKFNSSSLAGRHLKGWIVGEMRMFRMSIPAATHPSISLLFSVFCLLSVHEYFLFSYQEWAVRCESSRVGAMRDGLVQTRPKCPAISYQRDIECTKKNSIKTSHESCFVQNFDRESVF